MKNEFKPTGIRFTPRYTGPSIYLNRENKMSSVQIRGRRSAWKYSLNYQFAIRTNSKAHTWACHSPAFNQKLHKRMIDLWDRKLTRNGVSVRYINTYSLHRVL